MAARPGRLRTWQNGLFGSLRISDAFQRSLSARFRGKTFEAPLGSLVNVKDAEAKSPTAVLWTQVRPKRCSPDCWADPEGKSIAYFRPSNAEVEVQNRRVLERLGRDHGIPWEVQYMKRDLLAGLW